MSVDSLYLDEYPRAKIKKENKNGAWLINHNTVQSVVRNDSLVRHLIKYRIYYGIVEVNVPVLLS